MEKEGRPINGGFDFLGEALDLSKQTFISSLFTQIVGISPASELSQTNSKNNFLLVVRYDLSFLIMLSIDSQLHFTER